MKKINLLVLLFSLAFIGTSCGDDDKTPAELIIGKWTVESVSIDELPCDLDDTYTFDDLQVTYDIEELKCNDGDEQVQISDYTINESGTILVIDSETYDIDRLDEEKLIISYEYEEEIYTYTLTK